MSPIHRDANANITPISDLESEGDTGGAQGQIGNCAASTRGTIGAAVSGGTALEITDEEAMILVLALLA